MAACRWALFTCCSIASLGGWQNPQLWCRVEPMIGHLVCPNQVSQKCHVCFLGISIILCDKQCVLIFNVIITFLCVTKFAETLLTRFENLENCYFPNSPQTRYSVTPIEHMGSKTLAMMSKCFFQLQTDVCKMKTSVSSAITHVSELAE